MDRPEDIPEDVWAVAVRKAELLNDDYAIGSACVAPVAEVIARAIRTERERCRELADAEYEYSKSRMEALTGNQATKWERRMSGAWRVRELIAQGATNLNATINRGPNGD